jgi:hypothetical protein
MVAIIDQFMGNKAMKKVAKCHIDFIERNVNSYALTLNGPQQLEQIQTYSNLAASITVLQIEKDKLEAKAKEVKKKSDAEKAARKAVRNQKCKMNKWSLDPVVRTTWRRDLPMLYH